MDEGLPESYKQRRSKDYVLQYMDAVFDFHEEKGLNYEFNEYFKKWLAERGLDK